MLERTERPVVSRTPYAIDRSSARQAEFWWTVDALWLGRKNGRTTVMFGTLNLYPERNGSRPACLEDALAVADGRYGGAWHAKFDGEHLLVNPTFPLTPAEQAKLIARLEQALDSFPAPPVEFDGWFRFV